MTYVVQCTVYSSVSTACVIHGRNSWEARAQNGSGFDPEKVQREILLAKKYKRAGLAHTKACVCLCMVVSVYIIVAKWCVNSTPTCFNRI